MKLAITTALTATVVVLLVVSLRHPVAQEQRRDGQWHRIPLSARHGTWSAEPQQQKPNEQTPPGTRVLPFEKGRPIPERLNQIDEHVEVVDFSSEPFAGGAADPVEELQAHTRRADAVVVAKAISMRARFTEARDWIDSDVDFQIEDILKNLSTENALQVGQTISLPVEGGEMFVDGKRIVARPRWADIPREQGTYLFFLFWDRDQFRAFPATQTFEITASTLRRLQKGAQWGIDKNGITPTDAFDVIRSAAKLPALK